MLGDREVMNDQLLSVCEGAGYDEVYPSSHRPEEGSSQSSKREPSTHSLDDEEDFNGEGVEKGEEGEDEYDEGEGDEEEGQNEEEYEGKGDKGEDDGDGRATKGESLGSFGDGHTRPFILPSIWTVNNFKLTMKTNIFKTLQDRYQIPDNIPIRQLRKFEKCYSGKTVNISMYDAMFVARLRFPLTALDHQLAIFLGLSVS